MPYESCIIDLEKKGVSRMGAARACAIAIYKETGLMPGDSKLKGNKSDVSKQAEKIATQYSLAPQSFVLPGEESVRGTVSLMAADSIEETGPDPFQPMMIEEKGFTPRLLREVFLIRTGEFNGIPFNEEDLQALIDNWERPLPFQIDHSTAWKDNVGNLLSIRRQGKRVYGLAEFVGWNAIDAVQSGRAKEVSIGFYLKPRKLMEVSLTQFPAVGGKDPAQIVAPPLKKKAKPQLSTQKETPSLETPDSQTDENATLSTTKPAPGGQAPAKGNQMPEDPTVTTIASFSESAVLAQMNKQIADLEAKFATQQAENEKLSSQVQSANQILKLQRNTGLVVEFAQKGLMLTANKEAELEFINGLSDTQLEKYQALKQANGPVIAVGGRLSTPEDRLPGETVTEQDKVATKARLKANYASAQAETLKKS